MRKILIAALFLSLLTLVPAHAADQATCGQHIAGMAGIPEKLAMGAMSVADMLDAHAKFTAASKDKASQTEAKGLKELAKSHKQIAASLEKISAEMKKASSWPAAPHDMAKMQADPELKATAQKVITVHKEIIAELQAMVANMEKGMK
jgi:hypothetical protein